MPRERYVPLVFYSGRAARIGLIGFDLVLTNDHARKIFTARREHLRELCRKLVEAGMEVLRCAEGSKLGFLSFRLISSFIS